jgi:hypothetical protein
MRRGSIVKRPSGLFGIRYYANGSDGTRRSARTAATPNAR